MKRTRFLFLFILMINALLLSSCVTLLEEVNINEDGSGSLRFAVGVKDENYPQFLEMLPDAYTFENLLATLILDEHVESVLQDTYESDGQTWQSIQLNYTNFATAFENSRNIGPIKFSIDENEEGFAFEQYLNMAASTMSIPGVNLLDLRSASFTVRLTTPHITKTNGLQEAAGVSVWTVSLKEFLQERETFTHRADYRLEPYQGRFIAWETFYPHVVIGFLATGALSILIVIVVNTRKKGDGKDRIKFDI
ncbi:MAG: hypothetical protein ACOX7C_07275 [Brevefilum sp.]